MPELSRFFGVIIRMFAEHPIYRVVSVLVIGAHAARIVFDDGTQRDIDFFRDAFAARAREWEYETA